MTEHSIELLAQGLLNQFGGLQELESSICQLLTKQNELLEKNLIDLNSLCNEDIIEVTFMMKKMSLYRRKLKHLRSEMLYILQRITELKNKSLEIQSFKAEQRAEKIRQRDYEQGLIAKYKK